MQLYKDIELQKLYVLHKHRITVGSPHSQSSRLLGRYQSSLFNSPSPSTTITPYGTSTGFRSNAHPRVAAILELAMPMTSARWIMALDHHPSVALRKGDSGKPVECKFNSKKNMSSRNRISNFRNVIVLQHPSQHAELIWAAIVENWTHNKWRAAVWFRNIPVESHPFPFFFLLLHSVSFSLLAQWWCYSHSRSDLLLLALRWRLLHSGDPGGQ